MTDRTKATPDPSNKTPQQLADWLKEHLGPFPYGDHISLPKEETEAIWLKFGSDLHEFINGEGEADAD